MKAITGITAKHAELLDQYRMALSLWSETRVLYPPRAPEVIEATKHLEELEKTIREYGEPQSAPNETAAIEAS